MLRFVCDSYVRLGFNKRNGEEGLIELCYSFRWRYDGFFERRLLIEMVLSCYGCEDRNIVLFNFVFVCLNYGGELVVSFFSW